jgi:hypothetical protein
VLDVEGDTPFGVVYKPLKNLGLGFGEAGTGGLASGVRAVESSATTSSWRLFVLATRLEHISTYKHDGSAGINLQR